jgi:2'-5' RNA ligase
LKHRLFIALDLPTTLHSDISSLQNKLVSISQVFNAEPLEKLHLTLNFLGRVDDQFNSQLEGQLNRVAKNTRPFVIQPQFLETLYNRHESSLVYLGIGGEVDLLKELQSNINSVMAQLTLPQQNRFLPHVTIAKLERTSPEITKNLLDKVSDVEFSALSEFNVDHFTLYESLLSKSGSHYQKVRVFNFK